MNVKHPVAVGISFAAIAFPLGLAPLANAEDGSCTTSGSATVCASNGNAEIVATPPEVDEGVQNGPYGPAGDVAPVGGQGL